MNIERWYFQRRKKQMMAKVAPYTSLNTASYYGDGFAVELRAPKEGHTYLETGSHCVLDGRYVFETESGHIRSATGFISAEACWFPDRRS